MDELEISGKRYISTKRAGKEHGYHSDYIGQLIRGKKVTGQKVGRAWYVDETSLAEYLGKEEATHAVQTSAPVMPIIEKTSAIKEKVQTVETKIESLAEEILENKEVVTITEEKISESQIKINVFESESTKEKVEYTPDEIKYVAPAPLQVAKVETADGYRVAINNTPLEFGGLTYVEDTEPLLPDIHPATTSKMAIEKLMPKYEIISEKKLSFVKTTIVVVVGVSLFALTATACTYTSSQLVLEEGKTASVNYTFDF